MKKKILNTILLTLLLSAVCFNLSFAEVDISDEIPKYSISGTFLDFDSRKVNNIKVRLVGDNTQYITATVRGFYSFNDIIEGRYKIVPEELDYSFTPPEAIIDLTTDSHENDFRCMYIKGKTFRIEGKILDRKKSGIKEAIVELSGELYNVKATICDGYYDFSNLPKGNYSINVIKQGYAFKPAKKTYRGLRKNKTKQNFKGKDILKLNDNYENLTETTKRIKAYGWGEYYASGKCMCCDNQLDGDCIILGNVERTEKKRIKQIVDKQKPWDSNSQDGFFGEIKRRDGLKYVFNIFAHIKLKKKKEISKVIVWSQKKNGKSLLSNCEIGYLDMLGRIQWVGKIENNKFKDHIVFDMEYPIETKEIYLRVQDGKNRITEVDIFSRIK